MRPSGTAAELERRRRRAVELYRAGESATAIARFLGLHRSSLYRWLRLARKPGGLDPRPNPGRPPRLSDAQLRRLERLLLRGAKAHGWANDLWTAARVARLIRRHFGVSYHSDHVGRLLRRRLGWSHQKPRRRARERDEDEIERWKRVEFPRIVREAVARGAHLAFLDESGFQLTPCVRRTWAPRGRTPVLDAWDRRDRISAISALTVSPRRRRLRLHFHLLPVNANAHGEDVVRFLRQLKAALGGGPLTVVWDGNTIHDRSRVVRAYLARRPEVVTERLPGYAPELNPDEGVWGWAKYGRLANLAADDAAALGDQVVDQLVELRHRPRLLASFIAETGLPLAA